MSSKNNIFEQGPISPIILSEWVGHHNNKTQVGGHDIFIGQIRADEKDGYILEKMEYTVYEEMGLDVYQKIRDDTFKNYPDLTCMHVRHSIGQVGVGELCFVVMTSAPHRGTAFDACRYFTERFKKEMPLWGREIYQGKTDWKVNI